MFDFEDAPEDAWSKWGWGVALPCLMTAYATWCLLTQKATISLRHWSRHSFTGPDAVGYGIAVIALAAFLHAHFFWSNVPRLMAFSSLGRLVSGAVGVVAVGYVLQRGLMPF